MTRNDLIEALADYYEIERPNFVDGEYVIGDSYDWTSGCRTPGGWLSLRNVVDALEYLCEEN